MAKTAEQRDHIDEFLESIRNELPDIDLAVEGIVERIVGLSRRIKRMMEETLAEHELTWGEWKALGFLLRKCTEESLALRRPNRPQLVLVARQAAWSRR